MNYRAYNNLIDDRNKDLSKIWKLQKDRTKIDKYSGIQQLYYSSVHLKDESSILALVHYTSEICAKMVAHNEERIGYYTLVNLSLQTLNDLELKDKELFDQVQANLTKIRASGPDEKATCIICLDDIKSTDRADELQNCYHDEFHKNCL